MSPRALRSASIFGGIAFAAIVLVSWSQAWFIVTLAGQSAGHPDLDVAGAVSAPAVSALAIASAAAFGAMAISGRFFRVVLAALEILIGAGIVSSAVLALAQPTSAVEAAVTKATGVAGVDSIGALIGSNAATVWPYVGAGAGAVLGLIGVMIVCTAHRWPVSGRRYETTRPARPAGRENSPESHSVSDWDELSGGADPTSR
jgi:uncharacterized membrane protein (TIGR02234 family)